MNAKHLAVGSGSPSENSGSKAVLEINGLVLRPVVSGEAGEGLPYAPANWPNPGDIWKWKAGKRKNANGLMQDRYIYLPPSLQKTAEGRKGFASKLSLLEFIKKEYPTVDLDAFFATFSWKMPSTDYDPDASTSGMRKPYGSKIKIETMKCRVGNKKCSLQQSTKKRSLPTTDCDICCSESGFCRECCCILCCKTIDSGYQGYNFIRCQAKGNENLNYVCGHIAHIECALRTYMAGTIGGSIGLDAEYYCRRCDKRTDLIPYVEPILQTCESHNSKDDIDKILNMVFCILRGSRKEKAKKLLKRSNLVLAKLNGGNCLDEIWNVEDNNISGVSAGSREIVESQHPKDSTVYITSDHHRVDSSKLDDEINKVLADLIESQEDEYRIAMDNLNAQKKVLLDLYQQLETDRSELAKRTSSEIDQVVDNLIHDFSSKVNQIKIEVGKLKEMEKVAKGFGMVPKDTLKAHFGLQIEN
ncbi:protein OBERON 3-like isoform X1 [Papaver somniferum]|nr:protein OBERON 3-like isoform X1 [Papaver somniferum]